MKMKWLEGVGSWIELVCGDQKILAHQLFFSVLFSTFLGKHGRKCVQWRPGKPDGCPRVGFRCGREHEGISRQPVRDRRRPEILRR